MLKKDTPRYSKGCSRRFSKLSNDQSVDMHEKERGEEWGEGKISSDQSVKAIQAG